MGCGVSTAGRKYSITENVMSATEGKQAEAKEIAKAPKHLLLLGAGESGKSTILKQLIRTYGTGFEELRKGYNAVIAKIICETVQVLAKALKQESTSWVAELSSSSLPSVEQASAISSFWAQPEVKEVYEVQWDALGIVDNASYFLDQVAVVAEEGYLPTDQDMVNAREMTRDVGNVELNIEGTTFRVTDVGGQRNLRSSWKQNYDGLTALVVVVSLPGYQLTLREDKKMNRMAEALNMFEEVCELPQFRPVPKILVLNKDDLFQAAIQKVPLTRCFDDYFGDGSISDTRAFIRDKFLEKNTHAGEGSLVFPFVMSAASITGFQRSFTGIADVLFRRGRFSPLALRAAAKLRAADAANGVSRKLPAEASAVLDYWYCYENYDVARATARWEARDAAADGAIRERFGDLMARAAAGELDSWLAQGSEATAVALLLLKLEFPRRAHRGSLEMYGQHTAPVFLQVLQACTPRRPRMFKNFLPVLQLWLLRMMGYAESLERVVRALTGVFELQPLLTEGPEKEYVVGSVEAELKQRKRLLNLFMRYPHRNLQYGRSFRWCEKEYYLAEVGGQNLAFWEQELELLRNPTDIRAVRLEPDYSTQPPPQPRVWLEYWFGKKLSYERVPMALKEFVWVRPSVHKDNFVKEYFGPMYEFSLTGGLDFWKASATGLVAWLVMRCNVARSVYRNQPRSYVHDEETGTAVHELYFTQTPDIGGTAFENLTVGHQFWAVNSASFCEQQRVFDEVVLPFFDFIVNGAYWNVLPVEKMMFGFIRKNQEKKRFLLDTFGRLPYKNYSLGRDFTAEELEYFRVSMEEDTLMPFEKVLPEHLKNGFSKINVNAAAKNEAQGAEVAEDDGAEEMKEQNGAGSGGSGSGGGEGKA